jgi:hypothetical protein
MVIDRDKSYADSAMNMLESRKASVVGCTAAKADLWITDTAARQVTIIFE